MLPEEVEQMRRSIPLPNRQQEQICEALLAAYAERRRLLRLLTDLRQPWHQVKDVLNRVSQEAKLDERYSK